MTSLLSAFTGWLLLAALILTLGSLTAHWAVIPRVPLPDGDDTGEYLHTAATHLGWLGSGLLCVAMVLVFARQLVEFHDPFATWREDATLLLMSTEWGRNWRLAALFSLLAPVAFFVASVRSHLGWPVATVIVLGLAAFPAFTGHAAGTEGLRPLTLVADTLLLALKVALAGLVLALGALNWRRLTPRLGSDVGDAALRRAASIELLLAQVVLLVTAILVRTPPLGH